jgi:hypothetical protein
VARPFFYDVDVADLNAFEADSLTLPEWLPAFKREESRELVSEASTSAGPSPSPCLEEMQSPLQRRAISLSPEHYLSPSPSPNLENGFEASISPPPEEVSLTPDRAKWVQCRKVFVGGIPQYIDQNSLYKLLSKMAKVKKAWLQMFSADSPEGNRKHRGFGFVIFADKDAVDKLLGDDFSRILFLGEGLRLEVKRAIGKNGTSPTTLEAAPMTPGLVTRGNSDKTSPVLALSAAVQAQPQQMPPLCLPNVPPFPCGGAPSALPMQYRATLPMAAPVYQILPQQSSQFFVGNLASSFAFQGSTGYSPEDLEMVLKQAMPDSYQD